jgi:hypothetical protein
MKEKDIKKGDLITFEGVNIWQVYSILPTKKIYLQCVEGVHLGFQKQITIEELSEYTPAKTLNCSLYELYDLETNKGEIVEVCIMPMSKSGFPVSIFNIKKLTKKA